jgi:hypothetical protein
MIGLGRDRSSRDRRVESKTAVGCGAGGPHVPDAGDATRPRIVELLIDNGDLHQMEIVRRLGASQARLSGHLTCLPGAGSSHEGRKTVCRVADKWVCSLIALTHRFLNGNEAAIAGCRTMDA